MSVAFSENGLEGLMSDLCNIQAEITRLEAGLNNYDLDKMLSTAQVQVLPRNH